MGHVFLVRSDFSTPFCFWYLSNLEIRAELVAVAAVAKLKCINITVTLGTNQWGITS